MLVPDAQLYKLILDSGLVPGADLGEAAARASAEGARLSDMLVALGSISPGDIRRMQAYALGVPFVDLKGRKIPLETLSLIPEPLSRAHSAVAYAVRADGALEVALADPDSLEAIRVVLSDRGLGMLPRFADTESIKEALVRYQQSLKAEFGEAIQREATALRGAPEGTASPALVDALMKHALVQGASVIHIEPGEQTLARYRIGGRMHDAIVLPRQASPSMVARLKELAGLDVAEKAKPQSGRFKAAVDGQKATVSASFMPVQGGEKAVLRLMRHGAAGYSLESLGFQGEELELIHEALAARRGLILVAGPEGSGKTTTLYTMLDILDAPDVAISTVEESIEHRMPRVAQTGVRKDLGLSAGDALRAALRQDPDIVMVGDIRDGEAAALVVSAALAGKLVLASVRADSMAEAVKKLADMGVEREALTSALRAAIFLHVKDGAYMHEASRAPKI